MLLTLYDPNFILRLKKFVLSLICLKSKRCLEKKFIFSKSTTDETIEVVKKMISKNHRIPIREVADDVGLLFGDLFPDISKGEMKKR